MRTTPLFSSTLAVAAALFTTALAAPSAHARQNGFAVPGCDGCHTGGASPSISMQWSPQDPAPGETVTLDVAVKAVNGSVGGFYMLTDGRGELVNMSGQGTKLVDSTQVVHSGPRQASNGFVHFVVKWIAPEAPGGVVLKVWGVSGNGDFKPKGDGAGGDVFSFVYGCSGVTYYADHDGDGYGNTKEPVVDCEMPKYFAAKSGDCDENDPDIHPDASEICNNHDDDCDGEVDENLEIAPQYEDKDGDGHGGLNGDVVMAKCPPDGYAPTRDDCNDENPGVYEGATETCNYVDDDCDERIDEEVREVCGVGMCARLAYTCDAPVICMPGEPKPETCNLLDDDCDGDVDEGSDVCAAGTVCKGGSCVPGTAEPGVEGGGDGKVEEGQAGAASGCAVDSRSASPWGLALLLAPLCALSRRWRRRLR